MSARKPAEQKRRLGNPGQRRLPSATTVVALPEGAAAGDPPEALGVAGQALWATVVEFASKWIAPTDVPQLVRMCLAADELELLDLAIARDGHSLATDKGYRYTNPDLLARDRLEERVTKWSTQFGLTPVARSALGAFEVRARSDLQALVDRRTGAS